jgi:FKBP-type peptidyl-prolyl cis-trans isomerase FkpA
MRYLIIAVSLLVVLGAAACNKPQDAARATGGGDGAACPQPDADGVIEIRDGLVAKILKPGYGRAAESKDYADVHTTLWLYDAAADDERGMEIWTSGGAQPFQFQLDAGQVIAGWDLGVRCMLIGEKRELRIPPELGYGERGKPPVPPNATLLFEIELVNLTAPE